MGESDVSATVFLKTTLSSDTFTNDSDNFITNSKAQAFFRKFRLNFESTAKTTYERTYVPGTVFGNSDGSFIFIAVSHLEVERQNSQDKNITRSHVSVQYYNSNYLLGKFDSNKFLILNCRYT